MIGIYKITNPKGKIYIGQSINIENRFNDYKKLRSKSQILLHRSFLKYGIINHRFEILEECEKINLNEKERYWQDYYSCINPKKGLNLKLTDTKYKISELSIVSREKISKSNKGKIRTKEVCERISSSLKEYYEVNGHPLKGITKSTINNKLTEKQVIEIREMLNNHFTTKEISLIFNISRSTIQQIRSGKTWKSLGNFKVEGRTSRLKMKDLEILYKLFDNKTKILDIQKILPYCVSTIAKQRKIWKQLRNTDQK